MYEAHPLDAWGSVARVDDALTRLRTSSRAAELERLADELTADTGALPPGRRNDLVEVLVLRLCDETARDDSDAEDAICSALARLGVMRRAGNLVFTFRADDDLPSGDASVVARYDAWLPRKYAPTQGRR